MNTFLAFFVVELDCDAIGEFGFDPCIVYFGIVRVVPFKFLRVGIDEDSFRRRKFFKYCVKQ